MTYDTKSRLLACAWLALHLLTWLLWGLAFDSMAFAHEGGGGRGEGGRGLPLIHIHPHEIAIAGLLALLLWRTHASYLLTRRML